MGQGRSAPLRRLYDKHQYSVEQLHLLNRSYCWLAVDVLRQTEVVYVLYPCLKRLAFGAFGILRDILTGLYEN